jgi:hypothetical protein
MFRSVTLVEPALEVKNLLLLLVVWGLVLKKIRKFKAGLFRQSCDRMS